jgi:hypothetical protein
LIHSVKKEYVAFPFKEDEVGLLDNLKAAPDSPRAREYSREEDYGLYRYWGIKTTRTFETEYKRTHAYLKNRYVELQSEAMTEYVASLIKEFESDKEAS